MSRLSNKAPTTTTVTSLTTNATTTRAPCLCQNGGTCVYTNNITQCQCPCLYSGTLCQTCKHIKKFIKSQKNK